MDFIAIDFETANPKRASVCAAGWATVRDGVVVEAGSWLCRPPAGFDEFAAYNVGIHGITPAQVADQPSFAERVQDFLPRLTAGPPIVAHNSAFDMDVLGKALATCGRSRPQTRNHCTMKWSKSLLQLPTYNLPAVCSYLGITLERHHEAGSDALSAAKVAVRLAETIGVSTIAELDVAASKFGRKHRN
ncbi:MAG: exonuclease domain-containing protein [Mycobacterium sp.]